MDKLSDLELEKRIAEIEGITLGCNDVPQLEGMRNVNGSWKYYNPLTDKALLLDLMVKYKVNLSHYDDYIDVRIYDDPEDNPVAWIRFSNDTTNFSMFVLLCILGANNG